MPWRILQRWPMIPAMADMFVDSDHDPRAEPPLNGDERATLVGFLEWQRHTLELKASGLEPEAMARRAGPSSLSLLGLIRHMADVERGWFRRMLAGQDVPPLYRTAANRDAAFDDATADPQTVEQALEAWRTEVHYAERFVANAATLEITGRQTERAISLRWVLVHMIEEYARHNGHADLLREAIDGKVGQ